MTEFLGEGTETLFWLAGSVCLMLWGMQMASDAVTLGFGPMLRSVMLNLSHRPVLAALWGLTTTALMQSSTATCLMVASFAGRNIVPVSVGLAMMLGADVGTALVATILSFDISILVPVLLFGGFIAFSLTGETVRGQVARLVLGLGILLLGLQMVLDHMGGLADSHIFGIVVGMLDSDALLAMLFGAFLTWLAHSSLAMVLVFSGAMAGGVIAFETSLALVLGANIGAPISAILANWGGGAKARRVALGHAFLKWSGCFLLLPVAAWGGGIFLDIAGSETLAVLLFHCAVNFGLALIFLPLTGPVAKGMAKLIPDVVDAGRADLPQLLSSADIEDPSRALHNAMRETLRQGDQVALMLEEAMQGLVENDIEAMETAAARDDAVDAHYAAIKDYLTRLRRQSLNDTQERHCDEILRFTTNLEHLGDIIQKNLLENARRKADRRLQFSKEGMAEIQALYARVKDNLQLGMNVFLSNDTKMARRLLKRKYMLNDLERLVSEKHFLRLEQDRSLSIATSALHLDVLRDLKRINSHISSVCYSVLDAAGELDDARRDLRATARKAAEKAIAEGWGNLADDEEEAEAGQREAAGSDGKARTT